jgi:hypothetical protein
MSIPQHPTTRTTARPRRHCATRVLVLSPRRCGTLAPAARRPRRPRPGVRRHTVVTGVATVAILGGVGIASPAGAADAADPGVSSAKVTKPPRTPAPFPSSGPAASAASSTAPGPVSFDPSTLFTTGPFRAVVSSWSVDAASASHVALLSGLNLVVSLRQWTVAVYGAAASTPLTEVALTNTWGTGLTGLEGVPMPAGALPDPAGDGHLTVVQPSTGCVYDLFRARTVDGSWQADWANAHTTGSSGIYPDGMGTRAAGFSAALGLIWPQEIQRGRIDHALVFAYPYTTSAYVVPATRSDGRTTTAGALPIGARLRLDPALDLAGLGLSATELVIARALQEYGMVLGDTSGGFTLYAAHPRGLGYDPYQQLFGTTSDWASLAKIPKDRFQVLTLPAPTPRTTYRASCATLR